MGMKGAGSEIPEQLASWPGELPGCEPPAAAHLAKAPFLICCPNCSCCQGISLSAATALMAAAGFSWSLPPSWRHGGTAPLPGLLLLLPLLLPLPLGVVQGAALLFLPGPAACC